MARESMLMHYLRNKVYKNDPLNQIGTDADFLSLYPNDSPLRTVPTPTGDIAYVRKFGLQLSITAVTTIAAMADANQKLSVYAADGTLLADRKGGADNYYGSVSAQGVYVIVKAEGGAITVDASVDITFTGVTGALTCIFPAETLADGNSITYYISRAGSSYYSSDLIYGGARHTPGGLDDSDFPYFDIATAYAALNSANDGVEIMDSETYDEDLTTDNQALDTATTYLYSSAGQSPTITRGIGARVTREVSVQYNNVTAIYFNENGDDADAGTWQEPKLTIAGAIAARVAHQIVYGGNGATVISGIFSEAVTIAAAYKLEADYGYVPVIRKADFLITITNVDAIVDGFELFNLDITKNCIRLNVNSYNGTIRNCSIEGGNDGIVNTNTIMQGIIEYCLFENQNDACLIFSGAITLTTIVRYCVFNNNNDSVSIGLFASADTNTIVVRNCLSINCQYGYSIVGLNTYNGTFENNTAYNNIYGIVFEVVTTFSGIIRDCITYNNTTYDLWKIPAGVGVTITESNYGTNSGFTIGAGCITTNPEFCRIINPIMFGISSNSGAYRTDTSTDDMGMHLRIIEIDAADIIINGLKIDSQNQFNNAIFIRDSANHTGLNIKWCSIYNFQGIAIDLYDNDTNLDAIINNNLIYNNGNGIKLLRGGNTLEENIIFNNIIYGIYSDYTGIAMDHNVFYGNQQALYLGNNFNRLSIINSIFQQNSLYAINSEFPIFLITYCCITDAVSSNVDISDPTNIVDNPLFINTNEGEENFNIKTIETGYLLDSPCKDAGSSDIGAYSMDRELLSDVFKKIEFEYNPIELEPEIIPKGLIRTEGPRGGINLYSKEHKRIFPLNWGTGQLSSKNLRLQIALLSKIIQTRKNAYTKEQIQMRYHERPTTFLETGTAATVDATEKTIVDSGKTWIQDEFEGYWIGIKFDSDSGNGAISASGKTLTVSGAGWTTNEWIGYYIYYLGYYYLITANNATVLTLADPDGTLTDGSSLDWSIDKYFEIKFNTDDTITVYDEDDELIAGSYNYYIDFIVVKISDSSHKPKQAGIYDFENDELKTGFKLLLEQE